MRTIYRDLDTLRSAALPLAAERGRGGGYALDRSYSLPPVNFTAREAALLVALGRFAIEMRLLPFAETLDSALDKVRAALSTSAQRELLTRLSELSFDGVPGLPTKKAVRSALERAWFEQSPLRIVYVDGNFVQATRTIRILGVLMERRETRLDAVDVQSGERRHFGSIASTTPRSCASTQAPPRPRLLSPVSAGERILHAGKAIVRMADACDSDLPRERIAVAAGDAPIVRGRRRRGTRYGRRRVEVSGWTRQKRYESRACGSGFIAGARRGFAANSPFPALAGSSGLRMNGAGAADELTAEGAGSGVADGPALEAGLPRSSKASKPHAEHGRHAEADQHGQQPESLLGWERAWMRSHYRCAGRARAVAACAIWLPVKSSVGGSMGSVASGPFARGALSGTSLARPEITSARLAASSWAEPKRCSGSRFVPLANHSSKPGR